MQLVLQLRLRLALNCRLPAQHQLYVLRQLAQLAQLACRLNLGRLKQAGSQAGSAMCAAICQEHAASSAQACRSVQV